MQKSSKTIKSAYELKVVVKKLSQNLWDVSHTKYHRIGKASWLYDVKHNLCNCDYSELFLSINLSSNCKVEIALFCGDFFPFTFSTPKNK